MNLQAQLNNTVLMITHDVDEAVLLSDRVIMMTNGPAARIGEDMARWAYPAPARPPRGDGNCRNMPHVAPRNRPLPARALPQSVNAGGLEHRAKKWEPVFGNKRCDNKQLERAPCVRFDAARSKTNTLKSLIERGCPGEQLSG
jgi:energy-coupling factor transporter ATP-binding protein EcfA2